MSLYSKYIRYTEHTNCSGETRMVILVLKLEKSFLSSTFPILLLP